MKNKKMLAMLLALTVTAAGNVVVNRVVANCDIFRNVRTISEVVYKRQNRKKF